MKVELKCGDTITIPEGCKAIVKDGSVVFEKEEKEQEFKDGDVLIDDFKSSKYPCKILMIYKGTKSKDGCYECYLHRTTGGSLVINSSCCNSPKVKVRHATEEEKQELFDKMKEQRLRWNAEEKKVEKIRWRAEKGYIYHRLTCYLRSTHERDDYQTWNKKCHDSYNYFHTEEQAKEAAKRIREALRQYHEEIGE